MYEEYAKDPRMKLNLGIRRRLAPLLDGGRDEIELMHAILFSLPGSPVLYYGDEIAMGDNVYLGDRDGVRTPMQWTGDRNGGFSRADFAQLYLPPLMDPVYGFQAVNVEAQLRTADVAAALAAPLHRAAQAAPRLRARRLPRAPAREPEDLRPHPLVLRGHRPLRAQPRPHGAGGRARPLRVRRPRPGRAASATPRSRGSASCRTCSRSARAASSGSSSRTLPMSADLRRASSRATCTSSTGSSCSARSRRSAGSAASRGTCSTRACSTPASRRASRRSSRSRSSRCATGCRATTSTTCRSASGPRRTAGRSR